MGWRLVLAKAVAVLAGPKVEPRSSHGVGIRVQLALQRPGVASAVIAMRNAHFVRSSSRSDLLRKVGRLFGAVGAPDSRRL